MAAEDAAAAEIDTIARRGAGVWSQAEGRADSQSETNVETNAAAKQFAEAMECITNTVEQHIFSRRRAWCVCVWLLLCGRFDLVVSHCD